MSDLSSKIEQFIEHYNDVLLKSQNIAYFVRGKEFQEREIERINELIDKFDSIKNECKEANIEEKANLIQCLKYVAISIKNELMFILNLKNDEIDLAWDNLIVAQNMIELSRKNQPYNRDYLIGYQNKLLAYEQILFPKITFHSRGCIVGETQCSICNQNYNECSHIKGKLYMGELCSEIIYKILELEEVSIVDNPDDKRCRTISFGSKDEMKDIFTLRTRI